MHDHYCHHYYRSSLLIINIGRWGAESHLLSKYPKYPKCQPARAVKAATSVFLSWPGDVMRWLQTKDFVTYIYMYIHLIVGLIFIQNLHSDPWTDPHSRSWTATPRGFVHLWHLGYKKQLDKQVLFTARCYADVWGYQFSVPFSRSVQKTRRASMRPTSDHPKSSPLIDHWKNERLHGTNIGSSMKFLADSSLNWI